MTSATQLRLSQLWRKHVGGKRRSVTDQLTEGKAAGRRVVSGRGICLRIIWLCRSASCYLSRKKFAPSALAPLIDAHLVPHGDSKVIRRPTRWDMASCFGVRVSARAPQAIFPSQIPTTEGRERVPVECTRMRLASCGKSFAACAVKAWQRESRVCRAEGRGAGQDATCLQRSRGNSFNQRQFFQPQRGPSLATLMGF